MPLGTEIVLSSDEVNLTIASSGTNSTSRRTQGLGRASFQLPSAFTGTQVTVQVSNDDTNWSSCPVEGNEANPITGLSANSAAALPIKLAHFKHFRLVSGSAEGAERTISIYQAT